MRKLRETDLLRSIMEYLAHHPKVVFFWRSYSVALTGKGIPIRPTGLGRINGISDILGVLEGGRMLAIEVKMPKKYPSPVQRDFINNVNNKGGLAFVARSIDDVEATFAANGVLSFPRIASKAAPSPANIHQSNK